MVVDDAARVDMKLHDQKDQEVRACYTFEFRLIA